MLLSLTLWSCGSATSGPKQADNGSQQKTKSNTQNSTVKVPDPNASKDPKVGRQAGVGDDPSNLEVAEPNTGTAGSGGRQAHATR